MRRVRILAALCACLFWAGPAIGQGWKANIVDHSSLPPKFVVVDKAAQKLHLYGRQSPLAELLSFPCTTGQGSGDKQSMGDLRTPEGVYFVDERMARPLDWTLYGNLAYPLNYPNPVDRLKGKTGYGIWIHGRGKNLVPRDTRGCVAMNTPDLKALGQTMPPGTPVVISSEMEIRRTDADPAATRDMEEAVALVEKWARAWETGSEDFFGFYDPKSYTEEGEGDFSRFVAQKRSLFERYPWIRVMAHDVRALAGPDYVVTYFRQYYRSPVLVSEGISRLYWMRGPKGALRIVGREWERTGVTLDDAFLARSKAEIAPILDKWRKAWERADVKGYMNCFAPGAVQGDRVGEQAIREHKEQIWPVAPPRRVVFGSQRYALVPEGVEVTFGQTYAAQNGYEDKGTKTLLMVPKGAGWKILREDWRPL